MNNSAGRNNSGFAMISVLSLMTLLLMLAMMVLTSAMSEFIIIRSSYQADRNLYRTEKTVEEILAGLETEAEYTLEDACAVALTRLYRETGEPDGEILDCSDEVNALYAKLFVDAFLGDGRDNPRMMAEYLQGFASETENICIEIQKISLRMFSDTERISGQDTAAAICLEDCRITYQEPETDRTFAVTADLMVTVPCLPVLSEYAGNDSADTQKLVSVRRWRYGK